MPVYWSVSSHLLSKYEIQDHSARLKRTSYADYDSKKQATKKMISWMNNFQLGGLIIFITKHPC